MDARVWDLGIKGVGLWWLALILGVGLTFRGEMVWGVRKKM